MAAISVPLFAFLSALFIFPAKIPATFAPDSGNNTANATDYIRASCGATRYPDLCYASLADYAGSIRESPANLARVAISVCLRRAQRAAAYVSSAYHDGPVSDSLTVAALKDCVSTLGAAVDQMRRSAAELRRKRKGAAFRFQMSNVQTWMSAALTNQETCTDGFEEVDDCPIKSGVVTRVAVTKEETSNALALVNSYASKEENR